MSIALFRNHILTQLKTATGDMKIVPEGENFTPKGLQEYPFARFAILPRETVIRDISSTPIMQEAGLVAITLYFSRNMNSVTDALVLAEMIKDVFPVQNTSIGNGNQFLIQSAWIEAIRHEENVFGVPIFIRWTNLT